MISRNIFRPSFKRRLFYCLKPIGRCNDLVSRIEAMYNTTCKFRLVLYHLTESSSCYPCCD